jgi:hypothetical protein
VGDHPLRGLQGAAQIKTFQSNLPNASCASQQANMEKIQGGVDALAHGRQNVHESIYVLFGDFGTSAHHRIFFLATKKTIRNQ